MNHSNLGDTFRRECRLVIEDAAEVLAVGEDLVLRGKECSSTLYQVHAGKPVLAGDLLRPQMLLYRDGVVGTPFHSGIVRHDHAFAAAHPAYSSDNASAGDISAVHPMGRELRQLQKRTSGVQQDPD